MSQGLQLVILHSEDRVESSRMYGLTGGPHKAIYRNTSYTPNTYMTIPQKLKA